MDNLKKDQLSKKENEANEGAYEYDQNGRPYSQEPAKKPSSSSKVTVKEDNVDQE